MVVLENYWDGAGIILVKPVVQLEASIDMSRHELVTGPSHTVAVLDNGANIQPQQHSVSFKRINPET